MMVFRLAGFFLILALGLGHYFSNDQEPQCRCGPDDDCWPSPAAWNHFNETINGYLVQLRPVGAVCHAKDYSNSSCNELGQHYRNTTWRVNNPGKLAMPWEFQPDSRSY